MCRLFPLLVFGFDPFPHTAGLKFELIFSCFEIHAFFTFNNCSGVFGPFDGHQIESPVSWAEKSDRNLQPHGDSGQQSHHESDDQNAFDHPAV